MDTKTFLPILAVLTAGLFPAQYAHAYKVIDYNGIECAFDNNNTSTSRIWVPTTAGLYGLTGGVTYCPILQQTSQGYGYDKLAYVMLWGSNVINPRLCRRDNFTGTVSCGTNAPLGSSSWILYKPSDGSENFGATFLGVNVGSGISLISAYTAVWTD